MKTSRLTRRTALRAGKPLARRTRLRPVNPARRKALRLAQTMTATDLLTATEAERVALFGDLQVDANEVEKWGDGNVGALLNRMLLLMQAQTEAMVGAEERIASLVAEVDSLRGMVAGRPETAPFLAA